MMFLTCSLSNASMHVISHSKNYHFWKNVFEFEHVPTPLARCKCIDVEVEKSFTGTHGMFPFGRIRLLPFVFSRWTVRAQQKKEGETFLTGDACFGEETCVFYATAVLAYRRMAWYCIHTHTHHTDTHRIFLRRETFVILMTNNRLEGGAKPIIFRTLLLIRTRDVCVSMCALCVLICILSGVPCSWKRTTYFFHKRLRTRDVDMIGMHFLFFI